jgi:hypothetical protein
MKNKNKIVISVVFVLALLLVVVFVLSRKGNDDTDTERGGTLPQGVKVLPIDASVKVSVSKTDDGKNVILSIKNVPDHYETIEYEFSYDTVDQIPRGVLGSIEVDSSNIEEEIPLGSCSTNVCTYDEGVEKVRVALKFESPKGNRVFDKEFNLK